MTNRKWTRLLGTVLAMVMVFSMWGWTFADEVTFTDGTGEKITAEDLTEIIDGPEETADGTTQSPAGTTEEPGETLDEPEEADETTQSPAGTVDEPEDTTDQTVENPADTANETTDTSEEATEAPADTTDESAETVDEAIDEEETSSETEEALEETIPETHEYETSPLRWEMTIETILPEFEGDTEKEEAFLEAAAQEKAANSEFDYRELYRIAQDIKYAGIEPATPIRVEYKNSAAPITMSSMQTTSSESLCIDNLTLYSGFSDSNVTTVMTEGFMRAEFDVVNNFDSAKPIMAIVKLQNISTLVMQDVAIVSKTVTANSSETISAGFNVPSNASDYEILIELWDNNMNLIVSTITFPGPPPHASMTVANGSSNFGAYVTASGEFTFEYNNGIIETYVSNGEDIYINKNDLTGTEVIISGDLTSLILGSNKLTSFESTGLSSLTNLGLSNNQLRSFDGTGLLSLTNLGLPENYLTSFNGTGLSSLTSLNLGLNSISSFNGTGLSSLESLILVSNPITSFDGTGLSSLTSLNLSYNQLTSFDGTGLTSLTDLDLDYNPNLSELDLTGLSSLTDLSISGTSALTSLYLSNDRLSSVYLSDLPALTELDLRWNKLTQINVSDLTNLKTLILSGNQLTSLDVSDLNLLQELHINSNKNFSQLILPEFADVPSGNDGFIFLGLYDTVYGRSTSLDSAWNEIIDKLPTRRIGSMGTVYVGNQTLIDLLMSTLSSKYWISN